MLSSIRAKVIYNLVTEKNDFDGTSKNCGILMIGEDSGTIRKVEQMFELNGGIQCAMVKITQFGQNDSWPGGIGSTFSNLVVVANQVRKT